MGLFALPLGDTANEAVLAAITNLRLFQEGMHNTKYDNTYLLDYAQHCIVEAKKRNAKDFENKNNDGETSE